MAKITPIESSRASLESLAATLTSTSQPTQAICDHVDDEDKTSYLIQVSGSNYKADTCFINESDLYSYDLQED